MRRVLMPEIVSAVANENEDHARARAVLATLGLVVDPQFNSVIDPDARPIRLPEQQNVRWLGGRSRRHR